MSDINGREPMLHQEGPSDLTGDEPMLGGNRRIYVPQPVPDRPATPRVWERRYRRTVTASKEMMRTMGLSRREYIEYAKKFFAPKGALEVMDVDVIDQTPIAAGSFDNMYAYAAPFMRIQLTYRCLIDIDNPPRGYDEETQNE